MRAVVLLCLLEAAFAETSYPWGDSDDADNATVCMSDHMSCGCCLMQEWMREMEQHFNYNYEEMNKEMTKAKTALDNMTGNRSAFSVSLNNVNGLICSGPFSSDSIIVYEHAFINLKNHYSVQNGIFNVPYSGVYSLSVTIYASTTSGQTLAACANLLVNGNVVSDLHDNNGQDTEDSSTVVVAIKLNHGDQVSVNLPKGCVICDDDNHYNTFTGFLLYAH